jgi:hypothetical protein
LQHEVRNRFRLLITKRAGVIVSQPVAQVNGRSSPWLNNRRRIKIESKKIRGN